MLGCIKYNTIHPQCKKNAHVYFVFRRIRRIYLFNITLREGFTAKSPLNRQKTSISPATPDTYILHRGIYRNYRTRDSNRNNDRTVRVQRTRVHDDNTETERPKNVFYTHGFNRVRI